MKNLYYVPIIHTKADLGSLGEEVTKKGIAQIGEKAWLEHIQAVDAFWDRVSEYFDSLEARGMKVYQDGMVADGEMGRKIVDETAKMGSKNYILVLKLLQRGAILIKTEDLKLVKEERNGLVALTKAKSSGQRRILALKYKLMGNSLLNKRDAFIAKQIRETLNENETGVLFIGAFHRLKDKLPDSIKTIEVKDVEKVRAYQQLLPLAKGEPKRYEELKQYLIAKIVEK